MNILVQTPIPQFIHWKIPFTGNLKRSSAWNASETETSLFAAVFPHRHREKRTGQNMENYYKIFPGISVKVAPSKDGIRSFVFTLAKQYSRALLFAYFILCLFFPALVTTVKDLYDRRNIRKRTTSRNKMNSGEGAGRGNVQEAAYGNYVLRNCRVWKRMREMEKNSHRTCDRQKAFELNSWRLVECVCGSEILKLSRELERKYIFMVSSCFRLWISLLL